MRTSDQRLLRDKSAFTLLEVLVALSIIGIAMTTLFSAQSQSLSLSIEADFQTTAAMLANLKIAEIMTAESVDSTEGDFGEEFPGYRYKIEEENLESGESELLENLQESLQRFDILIFMGESDTNPYEVRLYKRKQTVRSDA